MKYGYIYEITNNINGKKYVGKRVGFKDVKTYMGSGIHLKSAQKKYGIENFSKRILNEYDTKEELCEAEKYFIAVYRYFYGREMMYNIADGGEGGVGREKGFKQSEEHKKKLSEAMKGKHHTEDHKRKNSEAHKGKQLSEETKQKLSEANTGENHPFYGKHHTEESKRKISENHADITGEKHPLARKVNQYDLNGNFIRTWSYIKDAERELGISQSNISKCCRGKLKSAGKFIWKYYE